MGFGLFRKDFMYLILVIAKSSGQKRPFEDGMVG